MTPADQRITEHLALKVCGYAKHTTLTGTSYWSSDRGVHVGKFDPIHDPRDCSIVMEAWRKDEHTLTLDLDNASRKYTVMADYGEPNAAVGGPSESWTRAVCEAIAAASGWKEGE